MSSGSRSPRASGTNNKANASGWWFRPTNCFPDRWSCPEPTSLRDRTRHSFSASDSPNCSRRWLRRATSHPRMDTTFRRLDHDHRIRLHQQRLRRRGISHVVHTDRSWLHNIPCALTQNLIGCVLDIIRSKHGLHPILRHVSRQHEHHLERPNQDVRAIDERRQFAARHIVYRVLARLNVFLSRWRYPSLQVQCGGQRQQVSSSRFVDDR